MPDGDLMAYDPTSRRILLYVPAAVPSCPPPVPGHTFTCRSYPPQTWTWDGDQWQQLAVTTPAGAALAVDPVLQRPLLIGYGPGVGSGACSLDTWVWDGQAWRTASSPVRQGVNARVEGLVLDPATGRLALMEEPGFCGGTTAALWRWDGTAWAGPAANQGAPEGFLPLGSDLASHQVVTLTTAGQTWTWDGRTWTERHPAHSPGPRTGATFAYDTARQRLVLFGTAAGYDDVPPGDTWTWDGSDWAHKGAWVQR